MGIIAGATIGAGILLTFFFIALVFFLYRRRKGSEYGPRGRHLSPPLPGPPAGRVSGPGAGVAFVVSGPGRSRNSCCGGWQKVSKLLSPVPGRKDVTLRKLDIKVETVNREPLTMHSDREDDTASISTATRVMKAIYSVRVLCFPGPLPSSHSWYWPCPHSLITTVTHASFSWLPLVLNHTPRLGSLQQRLGRGSPYRPLLHPSPIDCQNWKPLEVVSSNCLIAESHREGQRHTQGHIICYQQNWC